MKKLIWLSICLCWASLATLQAQIDYANAWYQSRASQTFVKLIVEADGLYRVTLQDLQDAGYDLSSVDARNLHLIYRGEEVDMYVASTSGLLTYLEFYGRRNDGRVDSIMYRDPVSGIHKRDLQPSKRLSLFSDASAYFLTWDNIPSANRYFSILDPTYSLYTPVDRIRYESLVEYPPGSIGSEYARSGGGAFSANYTLNSDFVTGEGYVGPSFGFNEPRTVAVPTPRPFAPGTALDVRTRVFGRSDTPHNLRIDMNGDNSRPVVDTAFESNNVYVRTYDRLFNPQTPIGESTDLTYHALRANTDNNNIIWASIEYDRLPDAAGDSTMIIKDWSATDKTYLRLTDVTGNDSVFVYDFKNRVRHVGLVEDINGTPSARVILFGFPNTRDLFLSTDAAIRKPVIQAARLNQLYETNNNADYIIITHRGLRTSAEAYRQYRDTATTNELTARIVYTDEIYDEFSYGTITPWAIKRFCKYAIDNYSTKPRYFFLWGKGPFLTRGWESASFVPTYGYPATDYEFVGHFDQNSNKINPEAAIGRVNIYSDDEGFAYLDKVNKYEHSPWDPWMKEGVFLGGGANQAEQNAISSAFNFMIDAFTDIPFGGKPHYFQKSSASTIIDPTTASYHDQITEGVQIIHFFGHSTSNILDISIRQPFEYNNFDRFPLMVAMGCYGGDFTGGESFGELWVKQPNRGAIGYLANSSAGYLNPLKDYGQIFYTRLYQGFLGQPLGDAIQQTLTTYTDSLVGIQYRNHGRQLNLQGDPAVSLYSAQRPDLEIDETSVYFTPDNFTAQDDSVQINIITNNYGLVEQDTFAIRITQRLPDGRLFTHPIQEEALIRYRDTLSYILKNPAGNAVTGQNFFEVVVDVYDSIPELNENNNRVNIDRLIPGNIPAILYPSEYAIVESPQVNLQASAFFMTRDEGVGYYFEIDTTANFDSPLRARSGLVEGNATYVDWDIPFSLLDSAVYYWRVRLADVTPVSWGNSSFKYIAGETGWAQSRLDQFGKTGLQNISINTNQQDWEFSSFGTAYEFVVDEKEEFSYSINGSLAVNAALNGWFGNSVVYLVIDQYTLQVKNSLAGLYEIGISTAQDGHYKLRQAIEAANNGDYIVVGSHNNPQVPLWNDETFEALEKFGVSENIRLLGDDEPFVVMGRKGYPNSATEVFSPNVGPIMVISNLLLSNYDEGFASSTRVGPSLAWDKLFWGWESQDVIVQEVSEIDVYAVRYDGTDSLVFRNLGKGSYDVSTLDADAFPFMRLEAHLQDTITRTAPQLDNWHVTYTPPPDAVVDPISDFAFQTDTIFEGEDIFIKLGARNISGTDMDSVKVRFTLERADRSRLPLDSFNIAPLLANGSTIPFQYTFNTLNRELEGDVLLLVEVNPGGEQIELHEFNNLFIQHFYVKVDRINPLMDVTFDGKHIIDGDLVSPRPEILIEVNDENEFVAITDTAAFELYFKEGDNAAVSYERIFVEGDPRVEWQPGELPDNKARLYFRPGIEEPLPDGAYQLRVQGKDQNGNAAGRGESFYEVRFEVENQSSMSQVLNYPNPFSTSTRFVFTLTGSEVPEVFQIHIYTISGKMVRVIDLKELGDVHIGRNITRFAWDGTDEYGDRLANGVYLYRVVTQMSSQVLEKRDEGIDEFFNNGWGKMYLMR